MTQILIDGIMNITFHGGVVRIECATVGPDGKPHPSGILMIPGATAGSVMQALNNGMQELQKKIKEHQEQQAPTVGNA